MVVISLPHASLLHPVALRRPPGPQQSSFISAKQTRDGNPTLPAANVLSGVSPACHIPQPAPNRKPRLAFMQQELTFPIFLGFPTPPNAKTPLSISTAPVPGVAAHLLSGVSPSGTILRSFPGQKPRLSKVLPNPIPHCKCSKRGFRFAAGHRALLDAETPLSTSEALRLRGWRLAGTAKPQPKNKAGAKDQPGRLGFAHHRDILNHQRAAIGGDYPQEDLIELLGGFNVNIHLGAVHISATNYIIRQQLVDR